MTSPQSINSNRKIAQLIVSSKTELSLFWATVSSIQTSPASLTLKIGGSNTEVAGIAYSDSYSPTTGDTVFGIVFGTDYLVLGRVAS